MRVTAASFILFSFLSTLVLRGTEVQGATNATANGTAAISGGTSVGGSGSGSSVGGSGSGSSVGGGGSGSSVGGGGSGSSVGGGGSGSSVGGGGSGSSVGGGGSGSGSGKGNSTVTVASSIATTTQNNTDSGSGAPCLTASTVALMTTCSSGIVLLRLW